MFPQKHKEESTFPQKHKEESMFPQKHKEESRFPLKISDFSKKVLLLIKVHGLTSNCFTLLL